MVLFPVEVIKKLLGRETIFSYSFLKLSLMRGEVKKRNEATRCKPRGERGKRNYVQIMEWGRR
jgi:hypothetical protein